MPTLHQYALHIISGDGAAPERERIETDNAVIDYVTALLGFLSEENSVRRFYFPADREPEARVKLLQMLHPNHFEEATDVLAERLNEKERTAEHGAIKIQHGDLLSVHLKDEETTYLLLAKLDQVDYLSRQNWKKQSGFPFEKNRLLKTCLCRMKIEDDAWEFEDVSIYDSNATISKFWWHDFLELCERTTNATNSQRVLGAWKSFLDRNVKPVSQADFHVLRNAIAFRLRSTGTYIHQEFAEGLLAAYQAVSSDVSSAELLKAAKEIPAKSTSLDKHFDERFEFDHKAVKLRQSSIRLSPAIDLVLKEPLADLLSVIKPWKADDQKGVFIVSDEGYQQISGGKG